MKTGKITYTRKNGKMETVDYLYQEKYNSKIQRLIKSVKFRFPQADIHSIFYDGRTINRDAITELSNCQFIRSNQKKVEEK
ncbi:MAG: hypothetical protein PHW34_07635 [Hespellia sp.]|nr:hypothetical protein [Hespellia sp.]